MGVGPAGQPRSPLAFPSGGWATFPMHGKVPHSGKTRKKSLCLKENLKSSKFEMSLIMSKDKAKI